MCLLSAPTQEGFGGNGLCRVTYKRQFIFLWAGVLLGSEKTLLSTNKIARTWSSVQTRPLSFSSTPLPNSLSPSLAMSVPNLSFNLQLSAAPHHLLSAGKLISELPHSSFRQALSNAVSHIIKSCAKLAMIMLCALLPPKLKALIEL